MELKILNSKLYRYLRLYLNDQLRLQPKFHTKIPFLNNKMIIYKQLKAFIYDVCFLNIIQQQKILIKI